MDALDRIADLYQQYVDVYNRFRVEKIIPLDGGSEGESRYLLVSGENKYLLSEADMDLYGRRFIQYYYWKDIAHVHINIPEILHKNCQKNHKDETKVLCVFTYVEGDPLDRYLIRANRDEAYRIGVQLGNMIKKIHAVEVDRRSHHPSPWLNHYRFVQSETVKDHRPHPLTDPFVKYYVEHSDVLKKYESTSHYSFVDGVGKSEELIAFVTNELITDNLVICDGKPGLKNISNMNVCDPIYEFRFMASLALCNEWFASGIVDGYFDSQIPEDFFGILKYYTCEYVIREFGKTLDENDVKKIMEFYDHLHTEIPRWYKYEA